MNKAAVYNQTGEKVAEMELNPKIFGIEKIDAGLVHFAVKAQRNNARHSIAHTKNRGEVSGSGKKPWKQKGTGRARAGSIRSPIWRGGGITFGPRSNRNYSLKINQSAWRKAIFSILTDKLQSKKLTIVDNLDKISKTKDLANKLKGIATQASFGTKYMLVIGRHDKELEAAGRNISNIKIIQANQLNAVDLIKYDLIVTKEAIELMEKTYLKN